MTEPQRSLSQADLLDLRGSVAERFGGRPGLASRGRRKAAPALSLTRNRRAPAGRRSAEATALLAAVRFAAINGPAVDDPQAPPPNRRRRPAPTAITTSWSAGPAPICGPPGRLSYTCS